MDQGATAFLERAAGCVAIITVIALWRLTRSPERVQTTLDGAKTALAAAGEWGKWMAGVQTATLAGLAWLLAPDEHRALGDLAGYPLTFAMGAFLFNGAGLFCCAWVLSATSSIALRLYEVEQTGRHTDFDVHEMSIFAAPSPKLGNVMALQHWLWSFGLISFALYVLATFF